MRLYSKNHLWIDIADDKARIGMTNFAQEKIGEIIFINLPEVGDLIVSGSKFGEVESTKKVTDLIAMVDGEVLAVNDDLALEPYRINENADNEWLIEVKVNKIPDNLSKEEIND